MVPPLTHSGLFKSFVMAGYECASQRRGNGQRLDLQASTGHARWAANDYQQLAHLGIACARDGLRWHVIETRPGHYDWSSFLPLLHAARRHGIQVIWDLCHYGYPDDLDIGRPAFVERFARFAGAVARLMKEEGFNEPVYCPINEISFWSWAGGIARRGCSAMPMQRAAVLPITRCMRRSGPWVHEYDGRRQRWKRSAVFKLTQLTFDRINNERAERIVFDHCQVSAVIRLSVNCFNDHALAYLNSANAGCMGLV